MDMQITDGYSQLLGIPAAMAAQHETHTTESHHGWTCRPQVDILSLFLRPCAMNFRRQKYLSQSMFCASLDCCLKSGDQCMVNETTKVPC